MPSQLGVNFDRLDDKQKNFLNIQIIELKIFRYISKLRNNLLKLEYVVKEKYINVHIKQKIT